MIRGDDDSKIWKRLGFVRRNYGVVGEAGWPRRRYRGMHDLCENKRVFLPTATPANNQLTDFQHMVEAKSGISGSLKLKGEGPLVLPIAVNPLFLNGAPSRWGDPLTWNNLLLVVGNSAAVANNIKGILRTQRPDGTTSDSTFSVAKTFESLEILGSQGPIERPLTVRQAGFTAGYPSNFDLLPSSVDIGVEGSLVVKWDVTLPSGANTVLDQQPTLELLEVKSGGHPLLPGGRQPPLRAGEPRHPSGVRQSRVHHRPGRPFAGVFHNNGTIFVQNGFTAVGSTGTVEGGDYEQKFFNTGEIRVESGPLTFYEKGINNGLLAIQGGSRNNISDFDNRGTFELRGGGGISNGSKFTNTAHFDWFQGSASGFTNLGQLRITGDGSKVTGGFTNSEGGVVIQEGSAVLEIGVNASPSVINNSGLWELTGAGVLTKSSAGSAAAFRNFETGTLRKSGEGTATIGGNSYFENRGGTVEVTGGTLDIMSFGSWTSGTLILDSGDISFDSRLNFESGFVTGSGTVTGGLLKSGGTINPGFSPGTLTFADGLTLGGGSTLLMEIAGDAAGEFDFIDVGGDLTLDGLLQVTLLDGFRPGEGERFALLDYGGTLTGTFDAIEVLGSDYQFAADYAADGSVSLWVTVVRSRGRSSPSPASRCCTCVAAGWPSHADAVAEGIVALPTLLPDVANLAVSATGRGGDSRRNL